jgi:amino acid transporter
MSLVDLLFGRPLASDEDRSQKIGLAEGIPIFGLDALGSAAYGPEAALTLLIPLGLAGTHFILPISGCIVLLLAIVFFSYRQTIEAYPSGGGSYIVASENLGTFAGLMAASALMIDYVLVVAVGIAAGIGALVSALPSWQPHTLRLCLIVLAIIAIVNLRGVREAGMIFMAPTYVFIVCLLGGIALGTFKAMVSGGHPVPLASHPKAPAPHESASMWLLLRAFSSGCTAMTGVEAVSNGVPAFREPQTHVARKTLTSIIAILMLLLAGIAYLCRAYGIVATEPGQPGYESILSQLIGSIAGKGWFYGITIASILAVLALQANTAFADFPRLCRAIAQHDYLPRPFANRGRRLVYSHGIYVLVILSAALLIFFGGVTDRLIPLFAVGAFLAFTFSQAGMVAHWKRKGGRHARHSILINGLGATVTGITVIVVIVSKFVEGAWITLLLIPAVLITMKSVRRHYDRFEKETDYPVPLAVEDLSPPLVVVPIEQWNKVSQKALRMALTISSEIVAVHIETGEEENNLASHWEAYVLDPIRSAGFPEPRLVILDSPYRFVITPIVEFVLKLEAEHPGREIAVLVPEVVQKKWYQYLMHNQRGELLAALLLLKGNRRISIVNVPWYRVA